jgi:phospholipase D1/2
MRGDRNSEIAVVIKDEDLVNSKMGQKEVQVGRFAHSLR